MGRPRKGIIKNKNNFRIHEPTKLKEVEFDRDKYDIIEQSFPFSVKLLQEYRLYWGDIGAVIKEYEEQYGEINNLIYYDKISKHVAILVNNKINNIINDNKEVVK